MKLFPFLITLLSLGIDTTQGADPGQTIYGPDVNLSLSWGYVSVNPLIESYLAFLPLIAITPQDVAPDCVKRQPLILVNDLWPPPTIRVKAKDKITLKAENNLVAIAFTIHLHGFDQVGTPWADGTSMFSTCPVPPDTKSSTRVFYAPDQPGTYIYHGHVGHAKVSGFTGLLIVADNPSKGVFYGRDIRS
jgi:hypothetical protein